MKTLLILATLLCTNIVVTSFCIQHPSKQLQQQQQQPTMSKKAATTAAVRIIDDILQKQFGVVASTPMTTKGGWDLRDALVHLALADDGKMISAIQRHGPPTFYANTTNKCRHQSQLNGDDDDDNSTITTSTRAKGGESQVSENTGAKNDASTAQVAPSNCFQSLCRVVAGQQLAGPVAEIMYKRLVDATGNNLCPAVILDLANDDMETKLRKPSSISNSKARSIVAIAEAFDGGDLAEEMFATEKIKEEGALDELRERLLKVKGIGPWTCDTFFMFHLEQSDVALLGDLGVRRGVTKYFGITNGKEKGGGLCAKKDADRITELMEPYSPYRSIFCYYMWKVLDAKDEGDGNGKGKGKKQSVEKKKGKKNATTNKRKGKEQPKQAAEEDPKDKDDCGESQKQGLRRSKRVRRTVRGAN